MKALHGKLTALAADELILDVRTDEEFAEGHVPGARNIPYDDVARHADELRKFRAIYLSCRSGGRVEAACSELMACGLRNMVPVLDGGMPDWISDGFPVER